MKMEVGKYYRTRDGEKVGPMKKQNDATYPFCGQMGDVRNPSFTEDGYFWQNKTEYIDDLIAEWTDEPASPQPAGPVRTITRKEIVPGTYGDVFVDDDGTVKVGWMSDAASIRAAIATLTEIADAMEGNSK